MKTLILSLALMFSIQSQAALSGYYDSVVKIEATLNSSVLANELRQSPITSVQMTGPLTVVVKSGICGFSVELKAIQPQGGRMGRTNYQVEKIQGPFCERHDDLLIQK